MKKLILKKIADDKKHAKLPSMQRVKVQSNPSGKKKCTLANREGQDEMPHKAAFNRDQSYLLRQSEGTEKQK